MGVGFLVVMVLLAVMRGECVVCSQVLGVQEARVVSGQRCRASSRGSLLEFQHVLKWTINVGLLQHELWHVSPGESGAPQAVTHVTAESFNPTLRSQVRWLASVMLAACFLC